MTHARSLADAGDLFGHWRIVGPLMFHRAAEPAMWGETSRWPAASPRTDGVPCAGMRVVTDQLTGACAVVIVVQHGEKQPSPGDPGLTEMGRAQAHDAAAVLAALGPVGLASSPLLRARETIAPLAEMLGLPVTVDPRLRERLNLQPGQSPSAFLEDWAHTVTDRGWTPRGGRSSQATASDMLAALRALACPGQTVVAASHGGATVDLLRTLLGDDELERRFPGLITQGVPGGALTTLRGGPDAWQVASIADTTHLRRSIPTDHQPQVRPE